MYYVGIDWADQKHDITIVDQQGNVISRNFTIKQNHHGFEKLTDTLRNLSESPEHFKIAIETPNNLVIDFLVDMGYPVFAIFPGSMKSFRKRYRSSGARDDQFDSFVLADVLRTDSAWRNWRKVDFGSELVREIRILARDHHHLVNYQTALMNTLRSTLKVYYPEYIQFFSDVACKTSLAFLLAYPDFQSARKLTYQQLSNFFKEQHFRNRKTIHKIYDVLHQNHLVASQPLLEAKKLKTLICARELIQMATDVETYLERIKKLVEQHHDSLLFLSYPGVSYIHAARLLALFGDNRNLYQDASELQALTGTCPVTEKSGKNYSVTYFRTACNKFYRDTVHQMAFSSLKEAQWTKAYYQKHRAAGKKHSHALRCLANVHLKILFSMWKNRTCYDENTFLAQRARHLL